MENHQPSDAPEPPSGRPKPLERCDPESIGPYELLGRLGEGGMGTVFLARTAEAPQQRFAVKVIKRGMDTRQVLARFDAERNALTLMNHPSVARILGTGETDEGQPYFVMEYVDGVPIDDFCRSERIDLAGRVQLLRQLCEGVQHAHAKGIVHRDLKPGNILVSRENGRPVPKIIDFGLAKALGRTLTEQSLATQRDQFIGTFDYMSPEQAESRGADVDTRTDIYALGVVLYELLTERTPFEELWRHHDIEILRIIQEDDPQRPSQRVRRLDERDSEDLCDRLGVERKRYLATLQRELDWIVMKSLEKGRDRRYETALALSADLERHLGGREPVRAHPPSTYYRSRKFARRYRKLIATLSTVIVILSVATTWNWVLRERVEEAHDRVLRLADLRRLRELQSEVVGLYPPVPERIPAFHDWLRRADELTARLPAHEAVLADLRPETEEELWERDQLRTLVDSLDRFAGPRGRISSVRRRLDWARRVEEETILAPDVEAAWSRARASIADREQCPLYQGLAISAQRGLIPLDLNPRTGLWEFWHPFSGDEPQKNEAWNPEAPNPGSRWLIAEETSLVFVLIPGGTYRIGAEPPALGGETEVCDGELVVASVDPGGWFERAGVEPGDVVRSIGEVDLRGLTDRPTHMQPPVEDAIERLRVGSRVEIVVERAGEVFSWEEIVTEGVGTPHVDPYVTGQEGPVRSVTIEPYFIAKYEMTQAQFARAPSSVPRPSRIAPNENVGSGLQISTVHPVEGISWYEGRDLLASYGLEYPNEAEWEIACRAGTDTPYWSGDHWEDLGGVANVADRFIRHRRRRDPAPSEFGDGFPYHAPVGSFAANDFGLHDTHGNVAEWCRDRITGPPASGRRGSERGLEEGGGTGPGTGGRTGGGRGSGTGVGFGAVGASRGSGSTGEGSASGVNDSSSVQRASAEPWDHRPVRGGSYEHGPKRATSARRTFRPAVGTSSEWGIRPARAVEER